MPSERPPAEWDPFAYSDADIDEAIAVCDGDPRACIHALLVACAMLEAERDEAIREASAGFMRARPRAAD